MAEQGKIKSVAEKKKFGFIARPGQEDAFFHFSDYPKGQTPRKGDELEFEVETNAKGPRAKNIKILKAGPADAAKTGEKSDKSALAPEPPKPPDLEVDAPLDPDESGDFMVTVTTRKNGKECGRNFKIVSPKPLQVWKEEDGKPNLTELDYKSKIETPPEGILQVWIHFDGTQTTLKFVLEDGKFVLADLVK